MRKEKRGLGVDRNGVQKMMRKRDYSCRYVRAVWHESGSQSDWPAYFISILRR